LDSGAKRHSLQRRLTDHAKPGLDVAAVFRFQERGHGCALLEYAADLSFPRESVLAENVAADLHVAGPIFCVRHDDSAGPHQNMIKIGFGASRPADVVQDPPAVGRKFIQFLRHLCFACSARGPGFLCPLGLIQLPTQPCYPFSCQP
jgi:hypothetical protein